MFFERWVQNICILLWRDGSLERCMVWTGVEVCVECEGVAKDRQDNQMVEDECNLDGVCIDIHREMC